MKIIPADLFGAVHRRVRVGEQDFGVSAIVGIVGNPDAARHFEFVTVETSRRRGATRTKLTIHEERKLEVGPRLGSRFKGYTGFIVQDLVIRPRVTHYQ